MLEWGLALTTVSSFFSSILFLLDDLFLSLFFFFFLSLSSLNGLGGSLILLGLTSGSVYFLGTILSRKETSTVSRFSHIDWTSLTNSPNSGCLPFDLDDNIEFSEISNYYLSSTTYSFTGVDSILGYPSLSASSHILIKLSISSVFTSSRPRSICGFFGIYCSMTAEAES